MSNLPSRRQLDRDLQVSRAAVDSALVEIEKWRTIATVLFRRLATEDGVQVRISEDLRADTEASWDLIYGRLTDDDDEVTGCALMCVPREEEPVLKLVQEAPE